LLGVKNQLGCARQRSDFVHQSAAGSSDSSTW
jgi:hypothetical protein